jgi:hypothetical protein
VTQKCTPSSLFARSNLPSLKPVCAQDHLYASSNDMSGDCHVTVVCMRLAFNRIWDNLSASGCTGHSAARQTCSDSALKHAKAAVLNVAGSSCGMCSCSSVDALAASRNPAGAAAWRSRLNPTSLRCTFYCSTLLEGCKHPGHSSRCTCCYLAVWRADFWELLGHEASCCSCCT